MREKPLTALEYGGLRVCQDTEKTAGTDVPYHACYYYIEEDGHMVFLCRKEEKKEQKPVEKWLFEDRWGNYKQCRMPLDTDYIKRFMQIEVVIDEEVKGFSSDWRAYYQIRGQSVQKEQALEIIQRTDDFFWRNIEWGNTINRDYLYQTHFTNDWIVNNEGWCTPQGYIGQDAYTGKYLEEYTLVSQWIQYLAAFPFLNVMIGIASCYDYDKETGADFESHIDCGIWVHDDRVEFLGPESAKRQYRLYAKKFGNGVKRSALQEICIKENRSMLPKSLVVQWIEQYYSHEEIEKYPLDKEEVLDALHCLEKIHHRKF